MIPRVKNASTIRDPGTGDRPEQTKNAVAIAVVGLVLDPDTS